MSVFLFFLYRVGGRKGSYLTSILLSGEIWILETVYRRVAVRTTEAENHRTDTVFEDVLIAKLAVFQASSQQIS